MARLAAYHQEDFQYHPLNEGIQQRYSADAYYGHQKNNLFQNCAVNNDRLRCLALSEPSLSPLSHAYKAEKMTLKHKPVVYGSQLIENSPHPMQYFDNDRNAHALNNRFSKLPVDMYDNSNYRVIYNDRYPQRHKHESKDKVHKRYSYVEPHNNNHPSDIFLTRNYERYPLQKQIEQNADVYDNRYQIPEDCYYEPSQSSYSPRSPIYYQNGFNNGCWQQWPLTSEEAFSNRRLLSCPSPLDSGLSSQSITSSPSLEAESFPCNADSVALGKLDRGQVCSCPSTLYSDTRCHGANLSRHDSGRSSGVYSAYRYPKESLRSKRDSKHSPSIRDNFNHNGYQNNQVRYGKLGLLGESTHNCSVVDVKPKIKLSNSHRHENGFLENVCESCYETDNRVLPTQRTPSRVSKFRNQQSKIERPFVVITEASEKSTESESLMTPEEGNSEKSDDAESSTTSESASKRSSAASSNTDLHCSKRSDRKTENEIRELEDMYEKCNLSDVDLLDRAERRDLPTAHQKANQKLKRSKSDTLYETLSPLFHNPYEIHQRAPPLRRSGIHDRVADDMALRKLKKSTTSSSSGTKNTVTYMLCSSHFTPTVPMGRDVLTMDYPDVEFDDLSYRKHYFGKKSKIADPQPPFGIPLRPPPTQKVFTDYLHVMPSDVPQPLCHPRGNPDVVRDDLAFRSWRKNEPERAYYDISQLYKTRN